MKKRNVAVCLWLVLVMAASAWAADVPGPAASDVDCDAIYHCRTHGRSWYEDNPRYIDPKDDSADWTFSTPEAQDMDADILDDGLNRMARSRAVFSAVILRNGAMVKERYFNGAHVNASENVHSASKSILGALVGIAIREKFLSGVDQRVYDFFPDYMYGRSKQGIRIKHMLNMQSGLYWVEDDYEYWIEKRENWIKEVLGLDLLYTAGLRFNYSTGNTHVLSGVLQKATGMGLCDFAHRYLFGHLGITAEHWGRDPQGYNSGGYNLYLTARELAKFGLLMLQKGQYNGKQIIPEQWVADSLAPQCSAGTSNGKRHDYGYLWWMTDLGGYDVKKAWGWGGQMIYLIPELNVVVVNTTNTRDFEQDIDYDWFIEDYVIPAVQSQPDNNYCSTREDCDDGKFCNGVETCGADGRCAPGTPTFKTSCRDCANGGFTAQNLSLRRYRDLYYKFTVPAGISQVRFETVGDNGDADLYVRRNAKPTDHRFDYYSYGYNSNEVITINRPEPGDYWIKIEAWRSFSGLEAKVLLDNTCD